jgi:hypothetical protein
LSSYLGQEGDANSPCFSPTDAQQLETTLKQCPTDCMAASGQGVCVYGDTGSLERIPNCFVSQGINCEAFCQCNQGFAGSDCHMSTSELEKRLIMREGLLDSLVSTHDLYSDFNNVDDIKAAVGDLSNSLNHVDEVSPTMQNKSISIINNFFGTINNQRLNRLVNEFASGNDGDTGTMVPIEQVSSLLTSLDKSVTQLKSSTIFQSVAVFSEIYSAELVPSQQPLIENNEIIKLAAAVYSESEPELTIEGGASISLSNTIQQDTRAVLLSLKGSSFQDYPDENANSTVCSDVVRLELRAPEPPVCDGTQEPIIFRLPNAVAVPPTKTIEFTHNCSTPVKVVTCNGREVSMDCGSLTNVTLTLHCQEISQRSCVGLSGTNCKTITVTDDETICSCDSCPPTVTTKKTGSGHRKLSTNQYSFGYLEAVAMSQYVMHDFLLVTSNLDAIFHESTYYQTERVLLLIGLMFGFLIISFLCSEKFIHDSKIFTKGISVKPTGMKSTRQLLASQQSRKIFNQSSRRIFDFQESNDGSIETGKENDDSQGRKELSEYLDSLFIGVFSLDSPKKRLMNEMVRLHLVFKMFLADNLHDRFVNLLELTTVLSGALYLMALMAGLEIQEDDGSCGRQMNAHDCFSLVSTFDSTNERCTWVPMEAWYDYVPDSQCVYVAPSLSMVSYVIIIAIGTALSLPMRITISFLFDTILRAPLKQDIEEEDSSLTSNSNSSFVENVVKTARKLSLYICHLM